MKLSDFIASLPELISLDFWKNSQTPRAESIFSSNYISSYWIQTAVLKFKIKTRLWHNPVKSLSLCSDHLKLDILTEATSWGWFFFSPPPFLFCHSSGSSAVPQSEGCVREDAARFSRSWAPAVETHLDLPLRAKGRGGCCWPTEDYSSYGCPCHSQIWQSYSGSFPSRTFHITQPDNCDSVRKEDTKQAASSQLSLYPDLEKYSFFFFLDDATAVCSCWKRRVFTAANSVSLKLFEFKNGA